MRCPHCSAEVASGQRVCVECGRDLTQSYRRPPTWRLWALLGVVAVLAIGAGVGFAAGALSGNKTTKRQATTPTVGAAPAPAPGLATSTAPPAAPTTPTAPTTTAPTTPAPTPAPGAATPPPTGGPTSTGSIASWPVGKTAYTAVLISAKLRSQADAKAREAIGRGISAGVLHSNGYASLDPGYWVVFAGQYRTADEARSKANDYQRQGFGQAYPRLIKK